MTAKLTPGPWHVNAIKANRIVGDETAPEFDKLMIGNHNATVATVYRPADARFIADAPGRTAELEAALVAAIKQVRRWSNDYDEEVIALEARVKSVLAKGGKAA